MARPAKKKAKGAGGPSIFDDGDAPEQTDDEDLPRDEAGRAKIKQQYVDLLAIRIRKLKGNILNRERINKTVEGIYFICARCEKVCHNLDEGLVEDDKNANNMCSACAGAVQLAGKQSPGSTKGDSRKLKRVASKTPRATKGSRTTH
jgi:hypothetical protein